MRYSTLNDFTSPISQNAVNSLLTPVICDLYLRISYSMMLPTGNKVRNLLDMPDTYINYGYHTSVSKYLIIKNLCGYT